MKKIITKIFGERKPNIHRAWDKERRKAARFGESHVQEIDAIFSRYL